MNETKISARNVTDMPTYGQNYKGCRYKIDVSITNIKQIVVDLVLIM